MRMPTPGHVWVVEPEPAKGAGCELRVATSHTLSRDESINMQLIESNSAVSSPLPPHPHGLRSRKQNGSRSLARWDSSPVRHYYASSSAR